MNIQQRIFDHKLFQPRAQIIFWILAAGVGSLLFATQVSAQACAFERVVNGSKISAQIKALPPDGDEPDPSTFSCQRVQGGISSAPTSCVSGGCPDYPDRDVLCCAAGTGGAPGAGTVVAPGSENAPTRPSAARFVLPDCTQEGDCELEDIVRTGVNFANFIFGISGAIFLAIFIYSGIEYLIFAQNSSKVQAAKRRLVDAAIGVGFIIFAGVLATFVYDAFLGSGRTEGPSSGEDSASGAEGTCICQAAVSGDIVRMVAGSRLDEARSACAEYGGNFDESVPNCTGPATQAECSAADAEMPEGVSCTWTP